MILLLLFSTQTIKSKTTNHRPFGCHPVYWSAKASSQRNIIHVDMADGFDADTFLICSTIARTLCSIRISRIAALLGSGGNGSGASMSSSTNERQNGCTHLKGLNAHPLPRKRLGASRSQVHFGSPGGRRLTRRRRNTLSLCVTPISSNYGKIYRNWFN